MAEMLRTLREHQADEDQLAEAGIRSVLTRDLVGTHLRSASLPRAQSVRPSWDDDLG
jgi:hypothetical protein